MTIKIAIVGAGSVEFGPGTVRDIMLSGPLNDAGVCITLMDVIADHLPRTENYAHALNKKLGRKVSVMCTTNLEEAIEGANFVVTAIEVDRRVYWAQDFHVPRQYGFRQIYGENGGPGGLFHALRNMGPMIEIARTMERLCPEAWLLNFTNPESKLCEALTRLTSVRSVGLCHGVYGGMHQIAEMLERPLDEIETAACGMNHITWFQVIKDRKTGEDLYPTLKEKEKQVDWLFKWDEIAMSRILFRLYGLYPSPSTNHFGEYIRWAEEFRAGALPQYFYDPVDGHPWETGNIPKNVYNVNDGFTRLPFPQKKETQYGPVPVDDELKPTGEAAVPIIEAAACGEKRYLEAVNVPNRGYIPNLPEGTVVEVPASADADGLHPCIMEPLPEAVACILNTQASIQKLLVQGFDERSKRKLLQAILLDPTVHSYRNAVCMMDEMLRLQKDFMPPLE